jgi:hypothetical protein
MWIGRDRLQVIDSALENGHRAEIERVLADIFRSKAEQSEIPSVSPTCRRDLIRSPLPGVGLFVSACPERHGAWMTNDVVASLGQFVAEHATVAAKKRHQLKLLNRLLVILAVVAPVSILLVHPERAITTIAGAVDGISDSRVSETNWPARGWMYKTALPTKGSVIDAHDELQYFHGLLSALDEGITNRLNIDGVLKTRRSRTEYEVLYGVYRTRQRDVLERLRRLHVPDRLKPIHARVILATEEQIRFYGTFTDAKLRDPSVDLGRMLGDTALKTVNQELVTAWTEIQRHYPALDEETRRAIESHLCGFDVI